MKQPYWDEFKRVLNLVTAQKWPAFACVDYILTVEWQSAQNAQDILFFAMTFAWHLDKAIIE